MTASFMYVRSMGTVQQIAVEFSNQVPNAGLLFLFPVVAIVMGFISTAGITIGALIDAKMDALDREKYMLEKMRREEARKMKLLIEGDQFSK